MEQAKAKKIKKTLKQTKERRKYQVARVYQLKLQNRSKGDRNKLSKLFLKASGSITMLLQTLKAD